MLKKLKTILIISTAIFGVLLLVNLAQATAVLDIEFQGENENELKTLFGEVNFMPGEVVTRWVKVSNNSDITVRIATEAINVKDDNGLGYVLNLEIKEDLTTVYNNSLAEFFSAGEVFLSDLSGNSNTQYDFSISFNSESDNPLLHGKSLGFDILFGSQGTEGGLDPGETVMGGGSGGSIALTGLIIHDDTVEVADIHTHSVTIGWTTSHLSTSQVIYGAETEKHKLDLTDNIGSPPSYGYEYTTSEGYLYPKVLDHSITIGGLDAGTTYHFRAISYASPPTISLAYTFTTLLTTEDSVRVENDTVETITENDFVDEDFVDDYSEIINLEGENEGIIKNTEGQFTEMTEQQELDDFLAMAGSFLPDFSSKYIVLIITLFLLVAILLVFRKKRTLKNRKKQYDNK